MLNADDLAGSEVCVEGRWVVSRPMRACLWQRLKDAWRVVTGAADAVRFWKQ